MKKVIRLISTLLLATSIFAMVSCSNDSVDNSTPAPQPQPENNKPVEKEITLTIKPGSHIGVYNEKLKDNTIGKGKLTFSVIPLKGSSVKVENLGIVVSENYKCYDYVVKNDGATPNNTKSLELSGIILSKEEIKEKEIKVKLSSNGVNIDFDRSKIAFDGYYLEANGEKTIMLNSDKNTYKFVSEDNKTDDEKIQDYIGEWNCLENEGTKYIMTINSDKKGSLLVSKDKTINFTVSIDKLDLLTLMDGTSKVGTIALTKPKDPKETQKLLFHPDKSVGLKKLLYTFEKVVK